MDSKPIVIIDPHFRKMEEIFSSGDFTKLSKLVKVVWGKNEPIPNDMLKKNIHLADVIICGDWWYGNILDKAKKLRAIISVSGGFPRELNYDYCFENNILEKNRIEDHITDKLEKFVFKKARIRPIISLKVMIN